MAKSYKLNQLKTYATLKKVFKEGVEYSEADIEGLTEEEDDEGESIFVEVAAPQAASAPQEASAPARRTITIGGKALKVDKAQKTDQELTKAGEGDDAGTGSKENGEGTEGSDKVTI